MLKSLDELGMIKQIIAKDNPYILETELRQDGEIPTIPESKNECENILAKNFCFAFAKTNCYLNAAIN